MALEQKKNIQFLRAQHSKIQEIELLDGQLILTDKGHIYADFPGGIRHDMHPQFSSNHNAITIDEDENGQIIFGLNTDQLPTTEIDTSEITGRLDTAEEQLRDITQKYPKRFQDLGGSVAYFNCLKGHAPSLIEMKYTNHFEPTNDSYEPSWESYTTFTEEDKVAFIADMVASLGYEDLILGGPWVTESAPHHAANVTIKGDPSFPLRPCYFWFYESFMGAKSIEVRIKLLHQTSVKWELRYLLNRKAKQGQQGMGRHILPLPPNCYFGDEDTIEIIFIAENIDDATKTNNIGGIGFYGEPDTGLNDFRYRDYEVDANKRIYMNELCAGRVLANIDEGSLDWEATI